MKKLLLIVGIVSAIACLFSLIFSGLVWNSYRHLVDGEPEHYRHLHRQAITFFVIGIILAAAAFVFVFIHSRL